VRRCLVLLFACLCLGAAPGGDGRLVDQNGRPVSAADLNGDWLLVYFGYSACPDLCPAALTTVAAVLRRLGAEAAALQPVFVSLDAAHDTPARLKAYAARFSPRLVALTGSEAAVADAARSFGVPWRPRADGPGLDHGTFIYLVAPGGQVVETFHPQQATAEIAGRIGARMRAARAR